jgi:hypothetical protein
MNRYRSFIALIALGVSGISLGQNPEAPLFPRLFPEPTGANGYEEYVRAADLLRDSDLNDRAYAASELRGQEGYLTATYRIYQDSQEILQLVRIGNSKLAVHPEAASGDFVNRFPEIAQFRGIARLYSLAIYRNFALGDAREGARLLRDQLMFTNGVLGSGTLIHGLVGYAIMLIHLASFQEHASEIPLAEALAMSEDITRLLEGKSWVPRVVSNEAAMSHRFFKELHHLPADEQAALLETYFGSDEGSQELLTNQMGVLVQEGTAMVSRSEDELLRIAGLREAERVLALRNAVGNWPPGDAKVSFSELSRLGFVSPLPVELDLAVRGRLRTMRLMAEIIAYRWRVGELPEDLSGPEWEEAAFDPQFQRPFGYARNGEEFEVWWEHEEGRIGLTDQLPLRSYDMSGVVQP